MTILGLQTSEDNRFYGIVAQFPTFSNKDKELVIQYQVKFPQKIDCGGGYIKLGPGPFPGQDFYGETPYKYACFFFLNLFTVCVSSSDPVLSVLRNFPSANISIFFAYSIFSIMFGPDFCGYSTKKTHVIFHYKGKNHLIKKTISPKEDQLSHLYTLIVKPDNSYRVEIDGVQAAEGKLVDDWDFLPPKTIPDPNDKKPEDWVDDPEMDDPEDKKPEGWDDIPKTIPDPDAKKPEDWDDALDGQWEPPMIDNPEYKGEWKPRRIPNPAYKGPWVQKQIPNPDYVDDDQIYAFPDFSWVGIDVWQVKSGTIFDNIIITDSYEEAKDFANKTFFVMKDGEKKMFDAHEAKKAEESKAAASASSSSSSDTAEASDSHDGDHDEL